MTRLNPTTPCSRAPQVDAWRAKALAAKEQQTPVAGAVNSTTSATADQAGRAAPKQGDAKANGAAAVGGAKQSKAETSA